MKIKALLKVTGALDYTTGKKILALLQETCKRQKMTVDGCHRTVAHVDNTVGHWRDCGVMRNQNVQQQLGAFRQRTGNCHALLLTAGELGREVVYAFV